MNSICPQDFQTLLRSAPSTALIDVRTPMEFAEVHACKARNEPLDSLDPQSLLKAGLVSKDGPVHLICRTGSRAEKAAAIFEKAGFANVLAITGGTQGWIEAGLPVERGNVKVMSLERQVRIVAGSMVLTGVLLGWQVHPGFYGLAGFVGAGLIFAGVTDFCGMGLLLARMPWNRCVPKTCHV